MSAKPIDASPQARLAELGERVLGGGDITPEEGRWLFNLESRQDIADLLAWANRIREHFKGNKVHLCSIVNVKAGGCPENCRFCAQSASYETGSPRHGLSDRDAVLAAADEAKANGVTALGLVAAWRGIEEGPALDQICNRLEELKQSGQARPDASLGIISSQKVADRLQQSGLECYNHNLETSRRFFPQVCTTHTYEERVQTLKHLKQAGIKICSGGILGMGETREDRCELAFALKELGAHIVPMNFLNPIPGTPFGQREPLAPAGNPQVHCLLPVHPAEAGDHGGRRADGESARRAKPGVHGRRQRADGRAITSPRSISRSRRTCRCSRTSAWTRIGTSTGSPTRTNRAMFKGRLCNGWARTSRGIAARRLTLTPCCAIASRPPKLTAGPSRKSTPPQSSSSASPAPRRLARRQATATTPRRPRLYLSTGIHGDEPAGPLAARQLLAAERLAGGSGPLAVPVPEPGRLRAEPPGERRGP